MKKRLACFIFAAAMVLSLPAAAFAADAPTQNINSRDKVAADENTRSVDTCYVNTDRLSNTSGSVNAYASFSSKASKAVCAIYLQEKYNGSWRTATGLGTTSYIKTSYNCNSIAAGKTFTLRNGIVYRAKVVFNDTINGTVYTRTIYSGSF